ncbi:MAG: PTS system mannose/fructose/sorbose family transporter subunit IID [Coriobacteriaceae bacterium]|nr:MAG: PTS system mannose/fructose/sorbose family transporter subunit IID [Coriobacteriaceae bacterium]
MPIAIIGAAAGALHLIYTSKEGVNVFEGLSLSKEEASQVADDALSGQKRLSKKTLRKSWFIWQSWGQICYNYERMMGLGFCHCMIPVLKELYGDDKEAISAGLKRHLAYFNTENTRGSIIPGITAAMEEERANGADIDDDMENNLKTALMGPMAGIGDSVTQGLVKVILLSAAIGLSSQGSALGPILLIVLFSIYALGVGYLCFNAGYKFGKNAVTKLLGGGLVKQLTEGLGAMGMMVLGCLVATVIPITCPLTFELATGTIEIQSILDTILPKLLPLVAFLVTYHFIKKGTKPTTVIIAMFIIAIILSPLGILS